MSITNLEKRIEELRRQVKKIMDVLELNPVIDPLEWQGFNDFDKKVIKHLLEKKYSGDTTSRMAKALELKGPEGSGRVLVWRSLKRIQRVSSRLKGAPIVTSEGRRWLMNYDEFTFKD